MPQSACRSGHWPCAEAGSRGNGDAHGSDSRAGSREGSHARHVSGRFDWSLSRPGNHAKLGYLLLLPAVLLIALIIVYPLLLSVDLSFQNVKIARIGQPRRPWTPRTTSACSPRRTSGASCWVTLKLVADRHRPLLRPRASARALLVNKRFRGRTLARLLVALPWAVPEVVAVVILAGSSTARSA